MARTCWVLSPEAASSLVIWERYRKTNEPIYVFLVVHLLLALRLKKVKFSDWVLYVLLPGWKMFSWNGVKHGLENIRSDLSSSSSSLLLLLFLLLSSASYHILMLLRYSWLKMLFHYHSGLLNVTETEGDVSENFQPYQVELKAKTALNCESLLLPKSLPSASILWLRFSSFSFGRQVQCDGIDNGLDLYHYTERQNWKLQHQLEQRTGILRSDPSLLSGRFWLPTARCQE